MKGADAMLSVLICDDDAETRKLLEIQTRHILDAGGIEAEISALGDIEELNGGTLSGCDIALLDIDFENSKKSGMDIARALRAVREDAVIIFVTNYIEYAPEGYEVRAFRYILKSRLDRDLERCVVEAAEYLRSHNDIYKIQVNGEIIDLPVKDILYLEVMHHSVTVYVQAGRKMKEYSIYASLSELERDLEPLGFLRIHKSYLANMRHLKKLQCREALLDTGVTLPVSEKSYRDSKSKYLLWRGVR